MKNVLDIPRTALEVFNMLPEGTLCEVIDNTLFMSPSPTTDHQNLLGELYLEIKLVCRSQKIGNVYMAPLDVYLDNEQSIVQPDLVFIKTENLSIIRKRGIYGAPDLVIEILSSNKEYDKEKKFNLYLRNQIPEYLIIDPDSKEVFHYIFTEGKYIGATKTQHGEIKSNLLKLNIKF